MFGNKKRKKGSEQERLFKREAYIPKSKLQKKERTVPISSPGRRRQEENVRHTGGFVRTLVVSTLWVLFFGEVIFVLFFANFFVISTYDIQKENNGDSVKNEEIKKQIEDSITGKWYGLIPKNNLLLLQTHTKEQALLTRYPKLASVTITKQFPHTLKIEAREKLFQVLWCSKDDCFLVNEEGAAEAATIFFEHPDEQGTVIRIQDIGEEPVQLGQRVMENEERRFAETFSKDFALRTGLAIEGSLERPSRYAKELRVHTNKGFTLFFNTRLPVDESLNTLMLILENEIPEEEWNQVDYIDLRTENRIYYTRKDRVPEKTEEQKKREEEKQKKKEEENKQESH